MDTSLYADDPLQIYCPWRRDDKSGETQKCQLTDYLLRSVWLVGWLVADRFWFDVMGKIKTVKRGRFSITVIQKWGSENQNKKD